MSKKDLDAMAYCGLCCAECPSHVGKIADLARDLRKELRAVRFDKMAEGLKKISFFRQLKDYESTYALLGTFVKMRCNRKCRGGGGPPFCKMRKCCIKNGYDGCWECDKFETCKHLDFLNPAHGDAHIKNLRKLKKDGLKKFMKGKKLWYSTPKKKKTKRKK